MYAPKKRERRAEYRPSKTKQNETKRTTKRTTGQKQANRTLTTNTPKRKATNRKHVLIHQMSLKEPEQGKYER